MPPLRNLFTVYKTDFFKETLKREGGIYFRLAAKYHKLSKFILFVGFEKVKYEKRVPGASVFEEAKQVNSSIHSGFVADVFSGWPDSLLLAGFAPLIVAPF